MALIICPECEKEISDKAAACPHCGYPLAQSLDPQPVEPQPNDPQSKEAPPAEPRSAPQAVELTGVKFASNPKKKKQLIIIAASIAALLIAFFAIKAWHSASVRETYLNDLLAARLTMLTGSAEAESVCNLTQEVWHNTIYKERSPRTDKYTKSGGYGINEDFNTSLSALYSDEKIIATLARIEESQASVAETIKLLQNPPKDLQNCYEALDCLYGAYHGLTMLAISPQGSLTTYSDNFEALDGKFLEYYQKLATITPEK